MDKSLRLLLAGLLAVFLAGCGTNSYTERETAGGLEKETIGGLAGAALGGLAGSQFGDGKGQLAATAAGVLIGGLAGSEVGRRMDERDRIAANDAVIKAHTAPLGEEITWNNPRNNHYGTITPTRDGYSESGDYCREFHQTIHIDGQKEDAYGVACRRQDGTWRIVEG